MALHHLLLTLGCKSKRGILLRVSLACELANIELLHKPSAFLPNVYLVSVIFYDGLGHFKTRIFQTDNKAAKASLDLATKEIDDMNKKLTGGDDTRTKEHPGLL
jgi:hypothetical protein